MFNGGELHVSKNLVGTSEDMVSVVNLGRQRISILGTQFAGEMKKKRVANIESISIYSWEFKRRGKCLHVDRTSRFRKRFISLTCSEKKFNIKWWSCLESIRRFQFIGWNICTHLKFTKPYWWLNSSCNSFWCCCLKCKSHENKSWSQSSWCFCDWKCSLMLSIRSH